VKVDVGFAKEAPVLGIFGMNVYHKNRLIMVRALSRSGIFSFYLLLIRYLSLGQSLFVLSHVTQHIDIRCCSAVLVPTDFPCTFYFSLCQPFWKVLQEGSSRGRSVVGIFTHMFSNCNLYYLCYFFLG
jgi:hypothetical protein